MIAGLLTTTEAGRQIGVSDARIRQLVLSGLLKGEKINANTLLIKQAELDRYLRKRKNGKRKAA